MKRKPDVIQLWTPVISFLRCYGVIPLRPRDTEPYFEYCPGSLFACLTVTLLYLLAFVISFLLFKDNFGKSSKTVVEATHYVIYYVHCETTVVFFLYRYRNLIELFHHWVETEYFFLYRNISVDKITKVQCWVMLIATIIMSSFENIAFVLTTVISGQDLTETVHLLVNLAGKGTNLHPYFGEYKSIYGFFLIFIEWISQIAWIAGDLIIAFISILLRRYYVALHEQLHSNDHFNCPAQLMELRRMHLALNTLTHKVAEVFSLLILTTVGCNVVYILAFLYSGLEGDLFSPSFLVRFIFSYSFIYVILRLTFSVHLASRLAEMPETTVHYLYSLPSFVGSNLDEQRTTAIMMGLIIQEIQSNPISLGGSGFFTLSRHSSAKLFSLIVTYEVIMLQWPH